jgi:hypothetical protein
MAQHYIRKAVRGRARALIGDAPDACLALQANKRHAWTHISFNEGMGGTLLNARLRLENRKKNRQTVSWRFSLAFGHLTPPLASTQEEGWGGSYRTTTRRMRAGRGCQSTPPRDVGPVQKQPKEAKREVAGRPKARMEGGSTWAVTFGALWIWGSADLHEQVEEGHAGLQIWGGDDLHEQGEEGRAGLQIWGGKGRRVTNKWCKNGYAIFLYLLIGWVSSTGPRHGWWRSWWAGDPPTSTVHGPRCSSPAITSSSHVHQTQLASSSEDWVNQLKWWQLATMGWRYMAQGREGKAKAFNLVFLKEQTVRERPWKVMSIDPTPVQAKVEWVKILDQEQ